jgi:hypothetical protein
MILEATRPRGDSNFEWHYTGPLPRWRGDRHLGAPRRGAAGQAATRGIHLVG